MIKIGKTSISTLLIIALLVVTPLAFNSQDQVYGATKKYKVVFKANGGKFTAKKYSKRKTIVKNIKKNKRIGSLPKIKRANYVFLGWYTKKSGGKKITKNTKIKKKTTVYARWSVKFTHNAKYTSLMGKKYDSYQGAEADLTNIIGVVVDRDLSISVDESGVSTADFIFDNKMKVRVTSPAGQTYYKINSLNLKAKNIVNVKSTFDYKIFMKKLSVSTYSTATSDRIEYKKGTDTWSILYNSSKKTIGADSDVLIRRPLTAL